MLSELLPGSQAGRARTRTPPMDTHAALGLAAPGTGLLARGSVCGGRCQHRTSEQLQYSSRSRQRLAPRTSGSPARSATGTPCAGRSASCAARVQVTGTARHRPRASRAPSGALGEQGEPGAQRGARLPAFILTSLAKMRVVEERGGDEAWPGTPRPPSRSQNR